MSSDALTTYLAEARAIFESLCQPYAPEPESTLTMKLYRFDDSEVHWVCARNEPEAVACYNATMNEDGDDDFYVTEVPREKWDGMTVADDDRGPERTPIAFYVGDVGNVREAFLVCSTCY